ncbi:hypothetical protein BUZ85_10525 [Mammaliicoccus sciuri]|nr:hypothetical protein BUZ85_10525 [Mammaliicoccus sciuri]
MILLIGKIIISVGLIVGSIIEETIRAKRKNSLERNRVLDCFLLISNIMISHVYLFRIRVLVRLYILNARRHMRSILNGLLLFDTN